MTKSVLLSTQVMVSCRDSTLTVKTPITVSLKMRDREEPAAAEADLGDSGGAPSHATSEDSLPCRICGGRVPRGVFPEHVAEHARKWL